MTTKITLNNIADTALATLTGPKVTTIVYPGTETATDIAGGATINLTGGGFQSGCSVLVASTASSVVTFISATQISFIAPALSAGTYVIYVINPDGGTAISIPGISYSGTPNWTTTAGSLGSAYETGSISATLTATGDNPVTYSVASGTLPTGSSLASDGTLSGTAQATASATTYTFTVTAKDAQNQTTNRSFSLTINPDVVTWSSPSDNTTYTVAKDTAISNVTMSATSAAGGSITYTADTLPTGLSITGANIAGTPTVTANTTTVLTATSTTTRTATKTINWVVNVANDIYFKNATLLLQGASTTFVADASTNNFAVTINGDTKPNNFNPYTPGYYSNYFDGNGDYLTTAASSAVTFGTGDYTIECWVYATTISDARCVFFTNSPSAYTHILRYAGTTDWQLYFPGGNTSVTLTSSNSASNFWVHHAITRSSGTLKWFINGVQVYSVANSTSVTDTVVTIGNYAGYYWSGYISNLRIVKGTALYTSAFTSSTTPLTAITNTSLLTCQSNRIIDNSTNNLTITRTGDTTVNSFDPFIPNSSYSTYGSTYFDGSGDYLTVPASTAMAPLTGDYTYECWVYPTSSAVSYRAIFGIDNYGAGEPFRMYQYGTQFQFWYTGSNSINSDTITINTWYHLAITRSSSVIRFFVNGTQVGSNVTSGQNYPSSIFRIGMDLAGSYPFVGYVSDLRAVKGTAVYTTAFTPPTSPLTAIANTSLLTLQNNQPVNNHTFLDNSSNNLLVTKPGVSNTTQGTFSPYGGNWSNFFDGTGDYLSVASNAVFGFGTGNFTVDFWFNVQGAGDHSQQHIFQTRDGTNNGLLFQYDRTNKNLSVISDTGLTGLATANNSITDGVWYHVALTRSGTTIYFFVNGAQIATTTSAQNFNSTTPYISRRYATDGFLHYFNGYISNLRMVTGTAVYISAFTSPTAPLVAITGTSLLTCADNRLVDDSPNNFTITKNGDVSVQRFSPFNPSSLTPSSYSGYFDGLGDWLTIPNSVDFAFGTGDFTVECWSYITGSSGTVINYTNGQSSNSNFSWEMYQYSASEMWFSVFDGGTQYVAKSTAFNTNQWNHLAAVRSGNTLTLYVNGVAGATTVSIAGVSVANLAGATLKLCSYGNGSAYVTGYISNVRINKGTAVYTSNFTPPTSPLTAISGTSLLTCQSTTFIDNSTNNFTITAAGNSQPTIQNPFGYTSATTNGYTPSTIGGSAYFDGTGDYLSLANPNTNIGSIAGDFTFECWINWTTAPPGNSNGNERQIIGQHSWPESSTGNWWVISGVNVGIYAYFASGGSYDLISSSSFTWQVGAWYHVAVVRSGSTVKIYLNGTSVGSGTSTKTLCADNVRPLTIGADNDGGQNPCNAYISDLRIVKGKAIYTNNFVPPAQPLTAVQNTVLLTNMTSAGIYDASTMNNLETAGDVKLSTEVSKFGGSSMYFDGTGDYLFAPTLNVNNLSKFLTSNFTVECWVYPTSISGDRTIISAVFSWGAGANYNIEIRSGLLHIQLGNSVNLTSGSISISNNAWTHIALVRSSETSTTVYVNGVSSATYNSSWTADEDCPLTIGCFNVNGGSLANYWQGYIDDLRITKGYARYTSNFTAPTSEFKTY